MEIVYTRQGRYTWEIKKKSCNLMIILLQLNLLILPAEVTSRNYEVLGGLYGGLHYRLLTINTSPCRWTLLTIITSPCRWTLLTINTSPCRWTLLTINTSPCIRWTLLTISTSPCRLRREGRSTKGCEVQCSYNSSTA